MDKDIKTLNRLLKQKNVLYEEIDNPDGTLTKLLISLIEKNHVFNETQISGILRQAFHKPNMWSSKCYMKSKTKEPMLILNYILTKHTITISHINELILMLKKYTLVSMCFDMLFDNNYVFTLEQLYDMYTSSYECNSVVTNKAILNLNTIYIMCNEIIKNKQNFNENIYIDIITKNNNTFDIMFIELIVKLFSIKKSGYQSYGRNYYDSEDSEDDDTNVVRSKKGKKNPAKKFIKIDKRRVIPLILDMLLVNCNDNNLVIQMISKYTMPEIILYYFIEKYGVNDTIVNQIIHNMTTLTTSIIIKIINKGYNLNTDQINTLFKNRILSIYTEEYKYSLSSTNKKTNNKLVILTTDLFDICGCIPTNETLDIACNLRLIYENKKAISICINILLEKYKLIPTYETLNACVLNGNCEIIQKILNYKLLPKVDLIDNFINSNSRNYDNGVDIVELLIKYGLVITEDYVKALMENDYYLNNLERFNIKYDENLYFTCFLNNEFPNEYMDKFTFDKKILELHKLCQTKCTVEKIQKYFSIHNISLDAYCLDYLAKYNMKVYRQLRNLYDNLMPNILTVYKHCNLDTEPIKTIAKLYNITTTDMFKQYDMVLSVKDANHSNDDYESEEE